jgi:hypothetical protein
MGVKQAVEKGCGVALVYKGGLNNNGAHLRY